MKYFPIHLDEQKQPPCKEKLPSVIKYLTILTWQTLPSHTNYIELYTVCDSPLNVKLGAILTCLTRYWRLRKDCEKGQGGHPLNVKSKMWWSFNALLSGWVAKTKDGKSWSTPKSPRPPILHRLWSLKSPWKCPQKLPRIREKSPNFRRNTKLFGSALRVLRERWIITRWAQDGSQRYLLHHRFGNPAIQPWLEEPIFRLRLRDDKGRYIKR